MYDPFLTFMLFNFLFFSGLLLMFIFVLRGQSKLERKMDALEKRLANIEKELSPTLLEPRRPVPQGDLPDFLIPADNIAPEQPPHPMYAEGLDLGHPAPVGLAMPERRPASAHSGLNMDEWPAELKPYEPRRPGGEFPPLSMGNNEEPRPQNSGLSLKLD